MNANNPDSPWNTKYNDFFEIAKGGTWSEGYQNVHRAMIVVHELAHIWAKMNNLDNGWQKNDRDDRDQQLGNEVSIYTNCFR